MGIKLRRDEAVGYFDDMHFDTGQHQAIGGVHADKTRSNYDGPAYVLCCFFYPGRVMQAIQRIYVLCFLQAGDAGYNAGSPGRNEQSVIGDSAIFEHHSFLA
jgi:hypothetical protein